MDQPFETRIRTATVRSRTSLVSQVATVAAVVVPPFGMLSAMGILWGVAFHWIDLVLLVVLYVLTALGNAIGFHRYFTHKGFETGPVVKTALAVLGSMAMQGPITQWVTDHRKHHALSDKEGDPHSPHVGHGDGVLGTIRGFLHSHVGWLFALKGLERGREDGGRTSTTIRSFARSTASTSSGSCSLPASPSPLASPSAGRSCAAARRWSGAGSCASSSTSTRPSA
jgi:fatty-acid desaturase